MLASTNNVSDLHLDQTLGVANLFPRLITFAEKVAYVVVAVFKKLGGVDLGINA